MLVNLLAVLLTVFGWFFLSSVTLFQAFLDLMEHILGDVEPAAATA
jgi:hypothetical protein